MAQKRPKIKVKDRSISEQKLIEAADEIFSKHGFDGATTREIANRAGLNLALIARYFDGKYGLLLAVLDRKINAERPAMISEEPKETFTEECISYASYRFFEMTNDLNFFKIVIAKFLTDEKFLKQFQETISLEPKDEGIVERFKLFVKQKKASPKLNIREFLDSLERQILSLVLFEVIMKRAEPTEVAVQLKNFVTIYAGAFEK